MLQGCTIPGVPNKCSVELLKKKTSVRIICNIYGICTRTICTRTYVRVHFALFGPVLSIKRESSTKINKTLIILTLLFSCRFLLPNLQDGSSAVLIQIRRLRYRRRTCICDQLPFFADHSATLWPSARLIFLLLFSHCFHCLRCWSLFSPGSAFIPHIRQNTAF